MFCLIRPLILSLVVVASAQGDDQANLARQPMKEEACAGPFQKKMGTCLMQHTAQSTKKMVSAEQEEYAADKAETPTATSTPVQKGMAVCTGCLFHTGCDARLSHVLCDLEGGIWRTTSEDDSLVENEVAEFPSLAALDFNEDGQISWDEVRFFLTAMGHTPSARAVTGLKNQIDNLKSSLVQVAPVKDMTEYDATRTNVSLVRGQEGRFVFTIPMIIAVASVVSTSASVVHHVASGGNVIEWIGDYIIDTITDPCNYVPGGKQTKKYRKNIKAINDFCEKLGGYMDAKEIYGIVFGGEDSRKAGAASRKCHRPKRWCTHKGALYVAGDCDGDGIADHFCSDSTHSGFISSKEKCRDTWPSGQCHGSISMVVIKVSDKNLYMHAYGGSKGGSYIKLHGDRAYALKKPNSKFVIEDIGGGKVIIKVSDKNLYMHAYGGSRGGSYIKLHGDRAYALQKPNSKFVIEDIGWHRVIIKVSDKNLYMHAYGGSKGGSYIRLHGDRAYALQKPNSKFVIED